MSGEGIFSGLMIVGFLIAVVVDFVSGADHYDDDDWS